MFDGILQLRKFIVSILSESFWLTVQKDIKPSWAHKKRTVYYACWRMNRKTHETYLQSLWLITNIFGRSFKSANIAECVASHMFEKHLWRAWNESKQYLSAWRCLIFAESAHFDSLNPPELSLSALLLRVQSFGSAFPAELYIMSRNNDKSWNEYRCCHFCRRIMKEFPVLRLVGAI